MYRSITGTWKLAAIVLSSALLFACSGDTGPTGAAGDSGAAGPPGPPGPPGPSGSSTVAIETAEKINVSYDSVTVPSGGGAPTVVVRLTDDLGFGLSGLPAANLRFTLAQLTAGQNGGSSEWQSYITTDSGGIPDAQATAEIATTGTYTDNGDGTYTYMFSQDLTAYPAGPTYEETKTHRLGSEIRTNSGRFLPYNIPANNAPYDFVPTGGAIIETRLIVNNDTCNACHDNLEFHGEARFDIEYCVTCHNPYSIDGDTVAEAWGGTVDMKQMIHKIHGNDKFGHALTNGYFIVGYGGRTIDYTDVEWSQDVRNCETCHDETNTVVPQASNWRTIQNRASCGSCHDDIDWAAGGHPDALVFADDTQCGDCHNETSGAIALHVPVVHSQSNREAGEQFKYNILSVSNTGIGEFPVVEYSVTDPTNGDAPYDLLNDPEWTVCGPARLAVGIAWDTADYHNNDSGSAPGLGISMNAINCFGGAPVAVGGGVFSVTSPVAVPASAGGSLAVTIDGHPAVDINGTPESIAVTNVVDYAPITDTTVTKRRNTVAIKKCDDCHNQLAMHGNNRTDNIEVCVTCHAPNVTDVNRRAGDCATDLGLDDTSVDMKYMIHRLHASDYVDVPYEVCGYGNVSHVYDFVYPGKLNNCEGCHVAGGFYPVDPAKVLGTTVDSGADPATPTDDVVISPNASVCSACHTSELAANHMIQNGGDFNATKAADSALISSGVETCALCHGEGSSADVAVMHSIDTFESN
ncbi:MAG: OmcA/MtrC family decaheme c-type cytochrome [Gammaproteobacteria bacterium]|nr:OmcA/MtrC family decaheme c-type cytochrome [Gammaproteobacteria bacterium]